MRVMVRSSLGYGYYDNGWHGRYGWSTFLSHLAEAEAEKEAVDLRSGGIATEVITEKEYDAFSLTHKIV
jgi:hypothetical protein